MHLGLGLGLGNSRRRFKYFSKVTGIEAGQSLCARIFTTGTPAPAIDWAAALASALSLSPARAFQVWNSGASCSDESSAGAGDHTVRLINASGDGSAFIDVSSTSQINPATSSTGVSNYWYNTQDNSAVSDGGALDNTPNTPGPLWRAALAKIAANGADWFGWSQGQTDSGWIGTNTAVNKAIYKTALKALFADMRTTAGKPDMPIFIRRIGRHNNAGSGNIAGYQAIRDLQLEITQEMSYVYIVSDEYDAQLGVSGTKTGCTTTGGSAVVSMSDTSGFAVGDIVKGTGIPDETAIVSIVANTSITMSANATVTNTGGATVYREDPVHPYPSGAPLDTAGNTKHDETNGFYQICARAVRGMVAGLRNNTSKRSFGPSISAISGQQGTHTVIATVTHDQGNALTTRNGAISSAAAQGFRIENNGTPLTITNLSVSGGNTLTFTVAETVADGTLSLYCAYGVMSNLFWKNFILDNAAVPMALQPTSPAVNAAMTVTVGLGVPVNTAAPVVSGSITVGSTLSCSTGTWTESPTSYAYQWRRDGSNISGATANTYVIQSADLNHNVDCVVTATNSVPLSGSQASNTLAITTAFVSSVQHVSITIPANATSATATIGAVGTKAFIMNMGMEVANTAVNDGGKNLASLALTNSTTVTATRGVTDTVNAVTVNAVVVDATANLVESVEFGTASFTGSSPVTATLGTTVDTSRSALIHLGYDCNNDYSPQRMLSTLALTNGSTVTCTPGTGSVGATVNARFCVVQFKAAAIQSVQQKTLTSTNAATTEGQAISAVTMNNTILLHNGVATTVSSMGVYDAYLNLTSTTNVNIVHGVSSATSRTTNYTVLEFAPGVLASMQRGSIALNAVNSNTATITTVGSKAALKTTGRTSNTNSDPSSHYAALTLTNATTITANRITAGTVNGSIGFEIVEFN